MAAFAPTLAGRPVESVTLDVPARGRWIARATLPEELLLAGQVELSLVPDDTWQGTIISGRGYAGRTRLIVVGGRNGLANWVPPKSYQGTPLSSVLRDTLSAVGETLQDDSGGILSRVNAHYVRLACSAIEVLDHVCSIVSTSWHTTKDLKVSVGSRHQSEISWDYQVTNRIEDLSKIEIASESGIAVPGNVIGGMQIVRASHAFSASKVRSTLWGAF